MNKDVLVSVEGLHFSGEETPGKVEVINAGSYYKKNDYHYIFYDEPVEGFEEVARNMIKFRDGEVLLRKKGPVNVDMLFEENRKNESCYTTPFGDIMLNINTRSVDILEEEQQIMLNVNYELQANYEHLADCRIRVRVCAREKGEMMFRQDSFV